jgi:hypothetical protein
MMQVSGQVYISDTSYAYSLKNRDPFPPNLQYSRSYATENFLQYWNKGVRREKGAKRNRPGHTASALVGYDWANPTFQVGFGEGPISLRFRT